jgi:sugar phosphate isomerase/epimerase
MSVVAAQLYSVRDFIKTPADIAKTLARLRKIGYEAVQLSALGPIDAKELARMLEGEGLVCAATHTDLARYENETQAVIDEMGLWNCKYTAVGGCFDKDMTAEKWTAFARRFNDAAAKFAGTGIALGYHNHSHELIKYDGKTALQILLEKLSPGVWMEIDTYWITHGGGDPAQWIGRCAGRIPCVHFKDMGVGPDRQPRMAEVGEGNLNWPAILTACREADVRWYIVEQDKCYRDPFDSLALSLGNLQHMGLR